MNLSILPYCGGGKAAALALKKIEKIDFFFRVFNYEGLYVKDLCIPMRMYDVSDSLSLIRRIKKSIFIYGHLRKIFPTDLAAGKLSCYRPIYHTII